MSTTIPSQVDREIQDKYVARVRARLARPKITVEDARDGILDCYVSTYYAGVKHGLKSILGVDASPDQVAQVTGRMFRDRLDKRGVSFDEVTVDLLSEVKEELDEELHFAELPVEVSATHDQVCSLLLAKADGLIEHRGDRSVLGRVTPAAAGAEPPPGRVTSAAAGAEPPPRGVTPAAALRPAPTSIPRPGGGAPPTVVVPSSPAVAPPGSSPVTTSLREALAFYLDDVRRAAGHASPEQLLEMLERARTLVRSLAEFSR